LKAGLKTLLILSGFLNKGMALRHCNTGKNSQDWLNLAFKLFESIYPALQPMNRALRTFTFAAYS
jgi:hypothetical protein